MIYLDSENIIIPIVNKVIGNRIKFINQVTKTEIGTSLSNDGINYTLDLVPNIVGQFDYIIYDSNDENAILQTGIASYLNDRESTSYSSNVNIKTYNG
jgi:hypothetical protein